MVEKQNHIGGKSERKIQGFSQRTYQASALHDGPGIKGQDEGTDYDSTGGKVVDADKI